MFLVDVKSVKYVLYVKSVHHSPIGKVDVLYVKSVHHSPFGKVYVLYVKSVHHSPFGKVYVQYVKSVFTLSRKKHTYSSKL